MRIRDMAWFNRPGVRLKKKGVSYLSDAELLAIILERGNKKENAIELADRLLKKYNFNKLPELSLTELRNELKDEVKAMKIQVMFEIFKKTNRLQRKGFKLVIESAKDVYNYFVDELKDKKKEYFYVLLLDTKNKVIKSELVSIGTLNASLIHPREVFKSAIKESANSIILVHNHPSGDCSPSDEDYILTENLLESAKLLKIKLVDHLIIGKERYWSYREDN